MQITGFCHKNSVISCVVLERSVTSIPMQGFDDDAATQWCGGSNGKVIDKADRRTYA